MSTASGREIVRRTGHQPIDRKGWSPRIEHVGSSGTTPRKPRRLDGNRNGTVTQAWRGADATHEQLARNGRYSVGDLGKTDCINTAMSIKAQAARRGVMCEVIDNDSG